MEFLRLTIRGLKTFIMKFSGDELTWRFAHDCDCTLYFDWANEPLVRKNAHQQSIITWENHEKWFRDRLCSDSLMLVFFHGNIPVGQVRVDRDGEKGTIDYSVDANYRGRNLGSAMLKILITMLEKCGSRLYLSAIVKPENVPSIRAFENSGFMFHGRVDICGLPCQEYQFHF